MCSCDSCRSGSGVHCIPQGPVQAAWLQLLVRPLLPHDPLPRSGHSGNVPSGAARRRPLPLRRPGRSVGLVYLQFVCVESLVTSITDLFPRRLRRPGARELLVLAVAVACFLLGLPLVSEVRGEDGSD